jgi:hypothetical protein
MATINRIFPHVNISTTALPRTAVTPVESGATVLFAPFISKIGLGNQVQKIFNLDQWVSEYGEPDFAHQGRTILNIYNWLSAGGAVQAVRLVGADAVKALGVYQLSSVTKFAFKAKNAGAFYNSVSIVFFQSKYDSTLLDAEIRLSGNRVQSFFKLSATNIANTLNASAYISEFTLTLGSTTFAQIATDCGAAGKTSGLSTGADSTHSLEDLISEFFQSPSSAVKLPTGINAEKLIGNKLEVQIDMILDAGYPNTVKTNIIAFTDPTPTPATKITRGDITVLFDLIDFKTTDTVLGTFVTAPATSEINHAFYTQRFSVNDVISGSDISVSPTYFLASLIPFNDFTYGIQWPTAGLTRGVLTGVKGVNVNPTADEKDAFYTARTNYVEKDSRGYKFMSQLTKETSDTSLKFINNVRSLNRMVRDIEELGREYLFEFNDAATLSNMSTALNRYLTEWIQNRTLSLGEVLVEADAFSAERVNVKMNIKFTGTIEIISVDIVIES